MIARAAPPGRNLLRPKCLSLSLKPPRLLQTAIRDEAEQERIRSRSTRSKPARSIHVGNLASGARIDRFHNAGGHRRGGIVTHGYGDQTGCLKSSMSRGTKADASGRVRKSSVTVGRGPARPHTLPAASQGGVSSRSPDTPVRAFNAPFTQGGNAFGMQGEIGVLDANSKLTSLATDNLASERAVRGAIGLHRGGNRSD